MSRLTRKDQRRGVKVDFYFIFVEKSTSLPKFFLDKRTHACNVIFENVNRSRRFSMFSKHLSQLARREVNKSHERPLK